MTENEKRCSGCFFCQPPGICHLNPAPVLVYADHWCAAWRPEAAPEVETPGTAVIAETPADARRRPGITTGDWADLLALVISMYHGGRLEISEMATFVHGGTKISVYHTGRMPDSQEPGFVLVTHSG